MPRNESGDFVGNHGTYSSGDDEGWAEDDEAIANAVDMMFQMCGTAGQEAIIGNACDAFQTWGIEALEGIGGNDGNYESFLAAIREAVGYEAWFGSQIIWDEGYGALSQQSNFHDGKPDVGEVGQVF